jgi:hypothetical protein
MNVLQIFKKIEYVLIIAVTLIIAITLLGKIDDNIDFARSTFGGLIGGNVLIEKNIDWEKLQCLDLDVGSYYGQLPNQSEKTDYRRTFIKNFSSGFKKSGMNIRVFTDWKVYAINNERVIVSAFDKRHKNTLFFTFGKAGGVRKLISITSA